MKTWIYSIIIVVAVMLLGSLLSNLIKSSHHHGHFSVLDKAASQESINTNYGVSSLTHIGHLDTTSVMINSHHFAIPSRTGEITMFACTECHNEPLDQIKNVNPDVGEKSHWNIALKHANSETMNCTTCHSENNMDELHTLTNKPLSFNESYKVCAQCHQSQFKDWLGGAHGKRVGGWAKPVVKNTCVNCHNPHQPSFPHKMPSRINTRMMEQRKLN